VASVWRLALALGATLSGIFRVRDRFENADGAPWAATGLLTFIAGFSEPLFLGLVQRIAVVPDKDATLSRTADAHRLAAAN
jgi:hypothetical protein